MTIFADARFRMVSDRLTAIFSPESRPVDFFLMGFGVCRALQVLSGEQAISTNFRYNEQIRISPVFLIDESDNKVGPTPTAEAQRRARDAGLDLTLGDS